MEEANGGDHANVNVDEELDEGRGYDLGTETAAGYDNPQEVVEADNGAYHEVSDLWEGEPNYDTCPGDRQRTDRGADNPRYRQGSVGVRTCLRLCSSLPSPSH